MSNQPAPIWALPISQRVLCLVHGQGMAGGWTRQLVVGMVTRRGIPEIERNRNVPTEPQTVRMMALRTA